MKKYICSILVVVVSLSGCNSFLDTTPYSNTVVENFYKTADDAELALTGCYQAVVAAVIQGEWGRGTFNVGIQAMMDAGTDECVMREGLSDPLLGSLGIGAYTAQNDIFKYNWHFLYAGINRTNLLLDRLDNIEMSPERKTEIRAEARFLRGFFYMYLGMFYGGVPVYVSSETNPMAPRNTLEEVFKVVIDDLGYAYNELPNRASLEGRANKWSAAGFLAKTYCYLASCKKNGVGSDLNFDLNSFNWVKENDCYTQARILTDDIILYSNYKLTQHYDYLFRETTAKAQYEECLFTAESTSSQAVGEDYGAWLFYLIPVGAINITGGGYAWYRPTGEMYYDVYNALDIRRNHNLSGMLSDKTSEMVNIDGVDYYSTKPATPSEENYCIAKFRYRDPKTKNINIALSEGNYPILRFADILLLNAEACYFTGNEPKARERLSDVRRRVCRESLGGTTAPTLDFLNRNYKKADFVTELLQERSRELCFEGQRRIDLIRFNKIKEAIAGLSDGTKTGEEAVWNVVVPLLQENWQDAPYRIWFPLPINDVLLNTNLVQNPGYQSK